jgi:hypothetical protein
VPVPSCKGVFETIATSLFEPCSCGSGLNFGDCCAKKVVTLEQLRWRTTARELKRKLGFFAQQPVFTEAAIWAQHLYLSGIAGSLFTLDSNFVGERCFEWFIFDFPVTGKETIIELFRKTAASELNDQETALLKRWSKAPNAFYEVKAVGKQAVLVEDILTADRFCVRGFENVKEVVSGGILYLRLLWVGEEFEFSTTGLLLPQEAKETILSWLKEDYAVFKRLVGRKRASWPSYLRRRAHRIAAWVACLGSSSRDGCIECENVWGERLDHLLFLLEEKILEELVRDCIRRERWKELFGEIIREAEEGKSGKGKEKKSGSAEGFAWPRPEYAEVARLVVKDLKKRGRVKEVNKALRLWYKFCVARGPVIRKVAAWAAAVVYTVARIEGDRVNQQRLAAEYGVSVSAVSVNHRLLCRSLGLF